MSHHNPVLKAHDFDFLISAADGLPNIGDRHQRLLEAGTMNCCAEGDFLALMSSVGAPAQVWRDGRTWLRRILGF
jgi:hypothetical protein